MVAKYFKQNTVPPVVVWNNCSKDNIQEVLQSMSLMIHMMMAYDSVRYQASDFEAAFRFF